MPSHNIPTSTNENSENISLSDVDRDPEPAEDNVRLEDLVLEGRPAAAGLPAPCGLLQLTPDAAHGAHGGPLELGHLGDK